MKRLTLLHTVKSVYETFPSRLANALGDEVKITNIVDEFLVSNTVGKGSFNTFNMDRLLSDMRCADEEGSDVLVVTCSSLTPYALELAPRISTPVITIDVDMCRKAALLGSNVLVLATALTAVAPACERIAKGLQDLEKPSIVEHSLHEDAMAALKAGDVSRHDEILVKAALGFPHADVIVLAQASMESAQGAIEKATGKTVLSSPSSCIEQVRRFYAERM